VDEAGQTLTWSYLVREGDQGRYDAVSLHGVCDSVGNCPDPLESAALVPLVVDGRPIQVHPIGDAPRLAVSFDGTDRDLHARDGSEVSLRFELSEVPAEDGGLALSLGGAPLTDDPQLEGGLEPSGGEESPARSS